MLTAYSFCGTMPAVVNLSIAQTKQMMKLLLVSLTLCENPVAALWLLYNFSTGSRACLAAMIELIQE
jgi:hypothetical protein